MKPLLIDTPFLRLQSYIAMVLIGFAIGLSISIVRAKRRKFPTAHIIKISLLLFFCGFVGARLFYLLAHLSEQNNLWGSGLSFYGGFALAALAFAAYARLNQLPISNVSDILAPAVPITIAISRVGCLLAGCCFGKPTSSCLGISFPEDSVPWLILGPQKVHPTQVYSSLSLFMISGLLFILEKSTRSSGHLMLYFVILYSGKRFIIDFLRYYAQDELLGQLSLSQVMSILLFLAASIYLSIIRRARIG